MIVTMVVVPSPGGGALPQHQDQELDALLPAGFGQLPVTHQLPGGETRAARVLYRCGVVDMDIKARSKIPGATPVALPLLSVKLVAVVLSPPCFINFPCITTRHG